MTYIIENVYGKSLISLFNVSKHGFFTLNKNSEDYDFFKGKIISICNYSYYELFLDEYVGEYGEINPDFKGKIILKDEETSFYFKLKYC